MPAGGRIVETDKLEQLVEEGYCRIENVLSPDMLARLRTVTERLVDAQGDEHAARQRNTGSMVSVMGDPIFAELVTWPAALAALRDLGYERPSFSDGWIVRKPGRGPRLFWHYDWFAWEDPASFRAEPLQVSLMYYLHDTRRENGCLRVVPGSHNRHNALHDVLTVPRGELTGATDTDRPEFASRPDEVDVPVRAGDVVIADARLLHAAHENATAESRTLITLWYQPDLASLPDRIQAQVAAKRQQPGEDWPDPARKQLEGMLVRYNGDAEPYGRSLYRAPVG